MPPHTVETSLVVVVERRAISLRKSFGRYVGALMFPVILVACSSTAPEANGHTSGSERIRTTTLSFAMGTPLSNVPTTTNLGTAVTRPVSPPSAPDTVRHPTRETTSTTTAKPDGPYSASGPSVSSVSPQEGGLAGGNQVVIDGSGLESAAHLYFGQSRASFVIDSNSELTATVPAASHFGRVLLAVYNVTNGGQSNGPTYTYLAPPQIQTVSPQNGPSSGGTSVDIQGIAFSYAQSVTFGATEAKFTVVSDHEIVAVSPPGDGSQPITVMTPGGASADSAYSTFQYTP